MNCPLKLSHVIREGDNLYHLARHYQTTVPVILSLNPNIDPYNLKIGSTIIICPGETQIILPNEPQPPAFPSPSPQNALINAMRLVWEQHVYWTRMLLISIAERLKDEKDVANRVMQNPADMAEVFTPYYSSDIARNIAQLITEHLNIGAALITALRDGKNVEAENLDRQWYINADNIAHAFSTINPYYNEEDLREMFYNHLDLTKRQVAMRLAGDYPADIEAFDQVEQQALAMADYFSSGIMRQFPQRFS